MDPGAAASIPREKGEGASEIYFFQLLHLSQLSQRVLRRFVGSDGGAVPGSAAASAAPPPASRQSPRARPREGWSQQPLLHQGGRAALGALMPQSEALPDRLALKRAEVCA